MVANTTLSTQAKQNWDPNRFKNQLSDTQTKDTMKETLGWYDNKLERYAPNKDSSPQSKQAYEDFEGSVKALKSMYRDQLKDTKGGLQLDRGERQALLDTAKTTDKRLINVIQNSELDKLLKPKSDKALEKTAEKQQQPAFNGRYNAVDANRLDAIAKNDGTMKLGDKGAPVKQAQELMLKHGAEFKSEDGKKDYGADGFMGPVTQRELKKLQKQWKLKETGALDQATLAKLRESPKSSAKEQLKADAEKKVIPNLQAPPALQKEHAKVKAQVDALTGSGGHRGRGLRNRLKKLETQMSPQALQSRYQELTTQRDKVQTQLNASGGSPYSQQRLRDQLRVLQNSIKEMIKPKAEIPEPIWV